MTGKDNRLTAGDNCLHNSITVRLIQRRHKTNYPFKTSQLVIAQGYRTGHIEPDSTLCSANHHGHIYCNAVGTNKHT